MKNINNKDFLSTSELAHLLSVSRITIFDRIKKGKIKAVKIGRNYIITKKDIPELAGISFNKRTVDEAVARTVMEYGETLRLLGKE